MSNMYAIKGSTLTALGDAIREKQGLTQFTEELNFTSDFRAYKTTTPSITAKNKFIINAIDMKYDNASSIYIYMNDYVVSAYRLFQGQIKDIEFPIELVADCKKIKFEVNIANNIDNFLDLEITTIPLDENGNEYKYTPLQMAEEINAMTVGPIAEELIMKQDCAYRFANNGWNWVMEKYGDLITTHNITKVDKMFQMSNALENIPFDLNFQPDLTVEASNVFSYCYKLKTIPKMLNLRVGALNSIFQSCKVIKEVPDDLCDTWDWTSLDGLTSAYSGNCSNMFNDCVSLKKFPMALFQHGNPMASYSNAVWNSAFYYCHVLNEILNMPNPHYKATYTGSGYSSPFNNMLYNCYCLRRFTFAPMDPPKWSNQTLDFTYNIGYANGDISALVGENAVEIKDDATYQEYKDHPDAWTRKVEYSRYNRTSAVETINSLPDTSTTGTANSIKFKGAAGSLTDGGAINTMTEEEIAVATAKGWTVSFA